MERPPDGDRSGRLPERPPLPPEDRLRVVRAALLRPMNVLMLIVGAFATILLSWWFLPLTLVTYTLLVLLASRDPLFERRVLGERDPEPTLQAGEGVSPDRRARWLPRGETRRQVEVALDNYRETVTAIEELDDVGRAVLSDAVPKLHAAAERLVDVAHRREKAATTVARLQDSLEEGQAIRTKELEDEIHRADAEISETHRRMIQLRARVAQISVTDGPENRATAAELGRSLDEINLRLEALENTMSSPEELPGSSQEPPAGQS
ncbi:MAG: hypothetical protein ACFB50_18125 [Rubrobacteraceae bacterium]